ncbi:DoxX family membrane protein [Streptomyces sp. NBC_01298]|uniref:Rieske 2Fe-2S domain-containing protein n=1 Tax=Streptomyces sp. NBC_01298 TaxID=2903817 RepID=UPI002E0FBE1A|nr:DoxX family membrane protein [Streptomyces sp. NBC_01298]
MDQAPDTTAPIAVGARPRPRPQPHPAADADRGLSRYALLPLRLFLGATFLYAGLDKLADPHYLGGLTDPASMAAQAHALAAHSPIGALLDRAAAAPVPSGPAMAFGELAVGFGTLLGLWGRTAALAGAVLNLTLWLSVSWGVHPYYLGNDLIYLVAWLPLMVVGTPHLSLDALLARPSHRLRPAAATAGPRLHPRRHVLLDGVIATLAVAGATLLTGAAAARSRPRTGTGAGRADAAAPPASAKPSVPGFAAASVPVGGALRVSAPGSGDPVYVQQPKAGTYTALSGLCTHSGCTVNPPKDGRFLCPCHNSSFDAATGAVLQGPATRALARFGITRTGDQLHLAPNADS